MGMDTFLVILIVILIIVVMIRGPKTLPLIGGMLGRGVKEVRKGASELQSSQDAPTDPNAAAGTPTVAQATADVQPVVPPPAPPVAPVPPAAPPTQPPAAPPAS
jgi:Sec-independent protein translocase protein TatA